MDPFYICISSNGAFSLNISELYLVSTTLFCNKRTIKVLSKDIEKSKPGLDEINAMINKSDLPHKERVLRVLNNVSFLKGGGPSTKYNSRSKTNLIGLTLLYTTTLPLSLTVSLTSVALTVAGGTVGGCVAGIGFAGIAFVDPALDEC